LIFYPAEIAASQRNLRIEQNPPTLEKRLLLTTAQFCCIIVADAIEANTVIYPAQYQNKGFSLRYA